MRRIAKVVVDLALDREFDYVIPDSLRDDVQPGVRVVVPFGRRETTGYVVNCSDRSDRADLKEIRSLVGRKPLLDAKILELARWMAEYYCAPIESAIRCVLPGAVRQRGARFKEQLHVAPVPERLDAAFRAELARRSPKQAAVADVLAARGGMFLSALLEATGASAACVRALEQKGAVRMGRETQRRDPLAQHAVLPTEPLVLAPEQASALDMAKRAIDTLTPPVMLLHGVTGSGKTEVYLQAIAHALAHERGAIVLVPEIALTPQTVERFRGRFGERIAVLHSHLSEGERHDEWHRLHTGDARIAIGARSAVFAPVRDLGLIVVDEEHEPSYKQEEAPRYHARDVAVMRGRMQGCAVLLGTATPSLESAYNVRQGKYAVAALTHRVDHRCMPRMQIVDMRVEAERTGRVCVFSQPLIDGIQARLGKAEQVMLFLNRRGYSSSLVCSKCGFVAHCDQCSVACTYHRHDESLRCHICGAVRALPAACPACRDPAFKFAGVGTQRIESIVRQFFPKARVQRMDSDVTVRKDSYRRILGDFRTGKIDILVGTQMIAKGLHFPNVTLIGVVYADLSLHMPDFRAGERTFQLLTQVAGRAGRGDVPGEVIVQTYTPFHVAVQAARRLDFDGFFDQEIEFRRELQYPPVSHLVCVTLRSPSEEKGAFWSEALSKALAPKLSARVRLSGPSPAPIARAKGYYRFQVLLLSPSVRAMTAPLRDVLKTLQWPPDVTYAIDVDAASML